MSAKDANTPGCCPEDSEPALKVTKSEAGTVVNLTSDLPAYVVGSPQAKAALIVAYSIFGFQGQSRIRQVCDQFAAAGFYVILPDYYRGDQWSDERQAKEGREGIVPFIAQFKWAGALENDFKAAVAHAREQPGIGAAGKIGAVGFCWGAWAAVRASTSGEISAAYSAHPSLQVEKIHGGDDVALAAEVKCPQMLDTAGSDNANMKEGGELFAVLQKHPFGDQCVTRDFPDMAHGWTTRGDLKVPAVAAAVDKALSGGIQFLKKHLLGESTTVPTITLGASKVSFQYVAREWRCKYTLGESGGPTDSASLAACEALLQEYLPTLKALPNATVSRIVCGGCGDFKVVVTQPAADHGAWGSKGFAPEQEFLAKLEAIDGTSSVEEQEYTTAVVGGCGSSSASSEAPVISLGASKVSFSHVAREWRCKYTLDANGGPHDSASLAACEALLQEYLPTLSALDNATVTRVVCGGCGDFKVSVSQPAADHDAWKAKDFAPEQEFVAKLDAIEGTSNVEEQEYTTHEF
eukprot:INCI3783.1.p1 GENE.INCI3783.1~~INCI3783.1.p1  ORF type:complete len:521 (+),score=117.40 INCI3783.1:389-1951(+)